MFGGPPMIIPRFEIFLLYSATVEARAGKLALTLPMGPLGGPFMPVIRLGMILRHAVVCLAPTLTEYYFELSVRLQP